MAKVTERIIDKLANKVLFDQLLNSLEYAFLRGIFYRELPSGLRHVIILDFNSKKQVFYILLGLNSKVVSGDIPPDEAGVYVSKYLGPGGLESRPQAYQAFKQEVAESSIEQVHQNLEKYGLPWLQKHNTLKDFADALGEQYDFFKGKLFFAERNYKEAEKWFFSYEHRLNQMPSDQRVSLALQETHNFIKLCRESRGVSNL